MSNNEKRSVSTDALETLGEIIGENEKRDAIHLAVAPVVAVEKLYPGQDVGLVEGGAGTCDKPVGIVDPFLKDPVFPGQRFWLVVYPRQINSLRHVWTHPAFTDEAIDKPSDPAAKSRAWIEDFAARIPLEYDVIMDGAADWVRDRENGGYGEYLCFGGLLEGERVPDEFWPHYEAVTGKQVKDEHRGSFFTCSC